MWFGNIFSHYVHCLFTLLIISLDLQKVFGLMLSHLSIFLFVACAFGNIHKIIAKTDVKEFFHYAYF